jgi:hypothetical protein
MIIRNLLLIIYTFGLLTEIRIFSGDQVIIPVVISFFIGLFFVVTHLPKYFKLNLKYFYLILLFFFLSVFFGPNKFDSLLLQERFLGFVQVFTSLIIAIAIFFELKKYHLKLISNFFLTLFFILIFGAIIEILTPFKFILDQIMQPLFPEGYYGSYDLNIMRDESLYSFYRPKFFTSEPSHLGKFASMCLLFWRLSTSSRNKNMIFLLLLIVAFLIIRSPLILFLIPIHFLIVFSLEKVSMKKINLIPAVGTFFLFLILIFSSIQVLNERINLANFGMDSSLDGRLIIPAFVTSEVLSEFPLFGVGIAGKEAIENIVIEKYQELDPNFKPRSMKQLLEKNHAVTLQYLIYFGLLGTFIIIFLLMNLIKSFGIQNWIFIILVFAILGFTHGKLTGLNTWTYFFVTCSLLLKNKF